MSQCPVHNSALYITVLLKSSAAYITVPIQQSVLLCHSAPLLMQAFPAQSYLDRAEALISLVCPLFGLKSAAAAMLTEGA